MSRSRPQAQGACLYMYVLNHTGGQCLMGIIKFNNIKIQKKNKNYNYFQYSNVNNQQSDILTPIYLNVISAMINSFLVMRE